MGISVQTSGIKVEQGKHYLVNLNADPSLNELLVYYLKVWHVHIVVIFVLTICHLTNISAYRMCQKVTPLSTISI